MDTSTMSVAHRILQDARQRGTRLAFGVHGANIEDIYAAAADIDLPTVVAKHEFAAGAMADGLTRVTGVPGLVLTTSGGGAMNVIGALAECYDSRVPILAVIGSAPTALVSRGAFQDMLSPPDTIDLERLVGAVTGHCSVIDSAAALQPALNAAAACLAADLPAALVIPKDVQQQPLPSPSPRHTDSIVTIAPTTTARSEHAMLAEFAAELADTVRRGDRVVIWVGEEASRRQVGHLVRTLADRLGANVLAAPGGMDATGTDGTHGPGITGVMGHPSAVTALAGAARCVAIGCRMSITDRVGLDDVLARIPVTHLGSHPPRLPGCTHLGVASLPAALRTLEVELADLGVAATAPAATGREFLEVPNPPAPDHDRASMSLRDVVASASGELPDDALIFADAGNIGATVVHHLTLRAQQRFGVALGMGGMGHAIAAAIGVAVAEAAGSRRRCVAFAGDGAFFMHGMEFHTAVEHGAPVTLIVANNDAHGMCVTREGLFFPNTISSNRFRHTDIGSGLAAMFNGIDVRCPTDPGELRVDCKQLFAADGPNCLVVETDCDEVPPFLPFLPKGP
ncbi:thiamine pyrophosphate-binding protein [Gordonia sp. NPDC003504]